MILLGTKRKLKNVSIQITIQILLKHNKNKFHLFVISTMFKLFVNLSSAILIFCVNNY